MKNCVRQNHITLQLKLKKQLIYNYYAITPLEMQCINKQIIMSKIELIVL